MIAINGCKTSRNYIDPLTRLKRFSAMRVRSSSVMIVGFILGSRSFLIRLANKVRTNRNLLIPFSVNSVINRGCKNHPAHCSVETSNIVDVVSV